MRNNAYNTGGKPINIKLKDGSTVDITQASDSLNISAMSEDITKYFLCLPKEVFRQTINTTH